MEDEMTEEMADEIFTLTIEAQRIENKKRDIRDELHKTLGGFYTWDEACTEAMKFKMKEMGAIS